MFFNKKKEVKKFEPNTLSKVLNVLVYVPVALMLLAIGASLFNPKGDAIVDDMEVVSQSIELPYGWYEVNSTTFSNGSSTINVSDYMPSTYGYTRDFVETDNVVGVKFTMYGYSRGYNDLFAVFKVTDGVKVKYIYFKSDNFRELVSLAETAGYIMVQYFV